jgi:hypothetical protein
VDRERIEKFMGRLVRVDLAYGQNLAGELRVPTPFPSQYEVLTDGPDGSITHAVFSAEDVANIILLHPAEAEEMKRDCTCTEADLMSWTTCPLHRFEGQ